MTIWIFRFDSLNHIGNSKMANAYSIITNTGQAWFKDYLCYQTNTRACVPSSLEEKKKLITAEVNNGYFHGL